MGRAAPLGLSEVNARVIRRAPRTYKHLSPLMLGLRLGYFAGWSRRNSSHSSISVPLGSTQMPRSPAVVFSMRVLPPSWAQYTDAGLAMPITGAAD